MELLLLGLTTLVNTQNKVEGAISNTPPPKHTHTQQATPMHAS